MSSYKQVFPRYTYKKAPLQEAIFEAKFSYDRFDSTLPGQFYEKVRSKFPEKNDLKVITIVVGTTASQSENTLTHPQTPLMQAWNADRTSCLQIGPGIITANYTKYRCWEEFTPAVQLLLDSYFECAKPVVSKKVGVRCINRFLIPADDVKISDYFCIGLALPSSLMGSNAFDITLAKKISYDDCEITARVRFTSDALQANETGIAFLLDIDSFVIKNIPTEPKRILEVASACHLYLKDIFESILQDKMRKFLEGVPT